MKEFMMLFHSEKTTTDEAPSPEQMQAMVAQWQEWIGEIAGQGGWQGREELEGGRPGHRTVHLRLRVVQRMSCRSSAGVPTSGTAGLHPLGQLCGICADPSG